jgi:hypothetical protein
MAGASQLTLTGDGRISGCLSLPTGWFTRKNPKLNTKSHISTERLGVRRSRKSGRCSGFGWECAFGRNWTNLTGPATSVPEAKAEVAVDGRNDANDLMDLRHKLLCYTSLANPRSWPLHARQLVDFSAKTTN